jgi:hypothetical protein
MKLATVLITVVLLTLPKPILAQSIAQPPVPGAIDPHVTQANIHETICKPGYTTTVRNVPKAMKAFIYRRDGMKRKRGVCCEIDHEISLELGGANVPKNLWAQPYRPTPGAHEKDALEDRLHALVCASIITLAEAQKEIAGNWYAAYLNHIEMPIRNAAEHKNVKTFVMDGKAK